MDVAGEAPAAPTRWSKRIGTGSPWRRSAVRPADADQQVLENASAAASDLTCTDQQPARAVAVAARIDPEHRRAAVGLLVLPRSTARPKHQDPADDRHRCRLAPASRPGTVPVTRWNKRCGVRHPPSPSFTRCPAGVARRGREASSQVSGARARQCLPRSNRCRTPSSTFVRKPCYQKQFLLAADFDQALLRGVPSVMTKPSVGNRISRAFCGQRRLGLNRSTDKTINRTASVYSRA